MVQSDYSVSSLSLLEIKSKERVRVEIELDNIFSTGMKPELVLSKAPKLATDGILKPEEKDDSVTSVFKVLPCDNRSLKGIKVKCLKEIVYRIQDELNNHNKIQGPPQITKSVKSVFL